MTSEIPDSVLKQLKFIVNQALSSMDQFSKKPELRIFDQQSYSTSLGQFMTIILMTIFSLMFGSSVYSIVNHQLPSISYNQEIVINTSPYYLDIHNFTFSITFLDEQGYHLVNISRYLQFELQNCLVTRFEIANKSISTHKSCTSYQMQQCEMDHNLSDYQRHFFQGRNLSGYHCINRTQWNSNPIIIQGTAESNTFQYLQIVTSVCKNTSQNTCETQEKIRSYLKTFSYLFIVDGNLDQLSNFDKPFQPYITTKMTKISASASKVIYHTIGIHDVHTDTGLIFNDQSYETLLGLSEFYLESNPYNGEYLVSHMILISEIKVNYFRSYQKLQTLFGQLGGLWQASISLFGLFIHPIVRKLLYLKLSNNLFNMKTEQIASQDLQNIDIKQRTKIYLQNQQKSIKVSSRNICELISGIKTPQQLQMAQKKISKSLDLSYILRKLREIDHLKNLLLTKEQNQLFNYLAKPSINNNQQLMYLDTLESLYMAYQKIQFDQSFISKLDPNLVQIFKLISLQGSSSQVSLSSSQRPNIRLNAVYHADEIISLEECAQLPK